MAGYSQRSWPFCKETKRLRNDAKSCGCWKNVLSGQPAGEPIDLQVKKILLGKSVTLTDLANKLETSPKLASEAVARLKAAGHNVDIQYDQLTINKEIQAGGSVVVDSADFFDGTEFKFGALEDTHLYSKYSRLDVLEALYDIYEQEGIQTVYHTGNAVDGEFRFNKFDLVGPSGIGPQLDYFAKKYPQRDGITTYFVTGDDHEGWWINQEGVNIGRMMQDAAEAEGRTDLKFIGHVETDVVLKAKKGQAVMRIMHPGGGSAYATSYTAQKIVESFQGEEKPHILLIGHYHKFEYGYPREVHVVQTGCTQDQTPFMRKNKIQAHVRGTIIRFHQANTGD